MGVQQRRVAIQLLNIMKESIESKIEEFLGKYLDCDDLKEDRVISFSNRESERKQSCIKSHLLKHQERKLICIEALLGLQSLDSRFKFESLSNHDQWEYLQMGREAYEKSPSRHERRAEKAVVEQKKMELKLPSRLAREREEFPNIP